MKTNNIKKTPVSAETCVIEIIKVLQHQYPNYLNDTYWNSIDFYELVLNENSNITTMNKSIDLELTKALDDCFREQLILWQSFENNFTGRDNPEDTKRYVKKGKGINEKYALKIYSLFQLKKK